MEKAIGGTSLINLRLEAKIKPYEKGKFSLKIERVDTKTGKRYFNSSTIHTTKEEAIKIAKKKGAIITKTVVAITKLS